MPKQFMNDYVAGFSIEASEFARQLVDNVRGGIAVLDNELRYGIWNSFMEELTGFSAAEVRGRRVGEVFPMHETDGICDLLRRTLKGENTEVAEVMVQSRADHDPRWVRAEHTPFRMADGKVVGVIVSIRDITERREQQNRIARLTRIHAMMSGINSAIVRLHDRKLFLQEACRIAAREGGFLSSWIGLVDPAGGDGRVVAWGGGDGSYVSRVRFTAQEHSTYAARPASIAVRTCKTVVVNDIATEPGYADAREELLAKRHLAMAAFPLKVDNRAVGVMALFAGEQNFFDEQELKLLNGLANDIGFGLQYIEKEEQLAYLAYYDPLTGLPNRQFFLKRLEHALQVAQRSEQKLVVVIGDMQRFHQINDTYGRNGGDELIGQIAVRLGQLVRNPEYLARLSSATFATILPNVGDLTEVAHRVELIQAEPQVRPFVLRGESLSIRMIAGIAIYPDDSSDAETLLNNAESALKSAKSRGLPYLFYKPAINAYVEDVLKLEHRLHRAIEREEFLLHYQPRVDAITERIVGLEALIRWNHPENGLIAPGHFIPLLEESGLIAEVGRWVVQRALQDFCAWREQGLEPPRIAVNVSIQQLRNPRFADEIREAIAECGAGAQALELEITESLFMDDINLRIEMLRKLNELGVCIAIDDFGTGYSSLSYLSKLPVHFLKIDRSFIGAMVEDPDNMTIVSSVISLAHALKLRVVAEGVETQETAQHLRLLKCDEMQGYLFARPMPASEAAQLLARQAAQIT
ncbi:MAG TPA: EAL domain-containing protein [Oxalicibacterium sp.]|nr:EAL domain-containing protein [Oxalicibacterium sp.]